MAKSISLLLVECLGLFNALVARSDLVVHAAEVPTSLWTDELGRLRVWAANIGAHQTGQSSLDYRLRDASHIKDQVIRLLERLRRSLVDLQDALNEPPEEAENDSSDDEETTEFEQIYNGLVELINSLFQMSLLIRCPARHDRLLGTSKEDTVTFEPYDRKHVYEKYPRAGDLVVDRLGTAISRRRAELKYRERHHAKLSQGINKLRTGAHDESQSIHDRESIVLSDTIATQFKEPNIQFDDTGSNSGISQTSYAPTLLEGGKAITVPPPPKKSANEQPFECPYCFFISTIKNRRSWARHVFRDIMPYICIFAGCSTPNRLYDSRREWYRHISTTHMLASADLTHECPLCQAGGLSASSFESHLGRHLEELALFALPRPTEDNDIESGQSRPSFEERPSDVSSEEEVKGEEHADKPPQIRWGMICNVCDAEIGIRQAYTRCNACTLHCCHKCEGLSSCRQEGHKVVRAYYGLSEDAYATLGVNTDADIDTIRSAHRRLVLQYRPDRFEGEVVFTKAKLEFDKIQRAYELLGDPAMKRRYDEDRRRQVTELSSFTEISHKGSREGSFLSEGLDGTTRGRASVDVQSGIESIKIVEASNDDGKFTWQENSGVRKVDFIPDGNENDEAERGEIGRSELRPAPQQKKGRGLWTEIRKDLVVREALERYGFEFEETEHFFYVVSGLEDADVTRLVRFSEDIMKGRRRRVQEIYSESRNASPTPGADEALIPRANEGDFPLRGDEEDEQPAVSKIEEKTGPDTIVIGVGSARRPDVENVAISRKFWKKVKTLGKTKSTRGRAADLQRRDVLVLDRDESNSVHVGPHKLAFDLDRERQKSRRDKDIWTKMQEMEEYRRELDRIMARRGKIVQEVGSGEAGSGEVDEGEANKGEVELKKKKAPSVGTIRARSATLT